MNVSFGSFPDIRERLLSAKSGHSKYIASLNRFPGAWPLLTVRNQALFLILRLTESGEDVGLETRERVVELTAEIAVIYP